MNYVEGGLWFGKPVVDIVYLEAYVGPGCMGNKRYHIKTDEIDVRKFGSHFLRPEYS
jgi:hypothetical protein